MEPRIVLVPSVTINGKERPVQHHFEFESALTRCVFDETITLRNGDTLNMKYRVIEDESEEDTLLEP